MTDPLNTARPPEPEAQRLQALRSYGVLDTPRAEAFDDLTFLAAQMCGTPVALIGFVDETRYWIKSGIGFDPREIPREQSFSAHAIGQSEILVVPDALADPRFSRLPRVATQLGLRFYAGVPLITPQGGQAIGTLCVLDYEPRELSRWQVEALRILGHQVITHLELRRNLRELERSVAGHLRAEEALRQAEEKYHGIFEHVMEGIYQTTPDGHYLSANPMLARIYGYDSADKLVAAIHDIRHQIYVREGRREDFARLIERDGTVSRFESQVYRKDGRVIWISESARAVRDAAGHLLYYEGTVEDITERRRAEDALRDSELLYHSLVECLPQNIFRKDKEGRFTFGNRRFCDVLGRSLEQIAGRTDFDFFPAVLAEKYQSDDRRVMESRQSFETVEEHLTPDRGKIYVQVVKTPLYDAEGDVIGVQGIFWDVTERRKMEEALAYERDLLRALLENIPDAIYFKDRQSRFLRVGKALAQKFGLENSDDAVGKTDFDFFSHEHAQAAFDDEQGIVRTGRPMIGKPEKETWHASMDTWVLSTKMPLRNQTGEVIGTFGISKDITQLKEAEQELAKARDAALEMARLKAEFLANMSHEIRTPMNCIIGMTGLLLDTQQSDEQREFTDTIRNSADALLAIINDILDFSKMEAGRLAVEQVEFDLADTLEGTAELLAEQAEAKGIELACWIDPAIPWRLRGDPGRIRQVLMNLLGNAIKFTERGEVVVRVTRQSETDDTVMVHCAVTDTGIGIAPEVREKLFQAFSQADGSLTRKYGGTGLGLAISKQLVELMDGHIGMVSTPGKGSTFWFSVRLPKAPTGSARAAGEPSPDLTGKRILIADDNPTVCQILSDYVAAWQMVGASAPGPEETLAALRRAAAERQPFDIVLLDLAMPGADSLGVAQDIRADAQLTQTRLVMVTSLGLHLDAEAWRRVGIDGHVVKPVKRSRLRECLSLAMRHAAGEGKEATTPGALAEHAASPMPPHPVRILVAEDNVVNQRIALRQLKKLGYTADAVANGQEAIEAVKRIPYDLVLMDCHMPELDGYEATRRIRNAETAESAPEYPPVHIIAMTANALEGDREACLAAGMNDYVSKPVKLLELQAALRRAGAQMPRRGRVTTAGPEDAGSESGPNEPEATEPDPTEPPIDPAVFESLRALQEAGQPDPAAELIDLFLADTPPRLNALAAAVRDSHASGLRESAHSLKGTASNLGARRLAALCAKLEVGAKAGDLANTASWFAEVTEEYRRVCFVLELERQKEKTAAPRRNSG